MRIEAARRRLTRLPSPLPPAPVILMPVLTDGSRRGFAPRVAATDRPAAVLVLIVPDGNGLARVILTERPTYDGLHSGEVSFPGGKVEPGDADIVATAVREAAEEVGLDPVAAGVEIVGQLDEVWIPVSRFAMIPILAIAKRPPVLEPSPIEVARIIMAPLATFLAAAPIRLVERSVGEWPLRYGAYPVATDDGDELLVWGATARILGQLGALLTDR